MNNRRWAILGLVCLIVALALISWYLGPGPDPPASGPLPAGLAAAVPGDRESRAEREAFARVFAGAAAVARSSARQNRVPGGRGEYRTPEQVFRAVRLANAGVLRTGREAAWRPFFDRLSAEIRRRYDRGEFRDPTAPGVGDLLAVAGLLEAVAELLDSH